MRIVKRVGIESGVSDPQQWVEIEFGGVRPQTLITFMYCKIPCRYKTMMDQSWINLSCISDDYEKGVEEFIEPIQHHDGSAKYRGKMRCPCVNF